MPTLLIVDDEKPIRDMFRFAIAKTGFELREAKDAKGLKDSLDSLPDLILLDVILSDANGVDLVRELKKDERTAHIPIIMLTAHVSEQSKSSSLEAGADDYILKPFSPSALLNRINNLLAQSHAA